MSSHLLASLLCYLTISSHLSRPPPLIPLHPCSLALRIERGPSEDKMDGRRVGVLGGGQLGRMMAEAGHRLGIQLNILDPGTYGWGGGQDGGKS